MAHNQLILPVESWGMGYFDYDYETEIFWRKHVVTFDNGDEAMVLEEFPAPLGKEKDASREVHVRDAHEIYIDPPELAREHVRDFIRSNLTDWLTHPNAAALMKSSLEMLAGDIATSYTEIIRIRGSNYESE